MDLSGIISVSGKPGLYQVLTQTNKGLVVKSITDGKKMPVYATQQVSALEDISIYTYEDDIPLVEVFEKIYEKENGKEAIHHKSDPSELRTYIQSVIEDYDEERVYASDLKKLFQWYNLLVKEGYLEPEEEEDRKEEEEKPEKKKPKGKSGKSSSGKSKKKKTTAKSNSKKKS